MTQYRQMSGMSLASVVVAIVLLGTVTVGIVRYASSVGQFRRELDTRGQENAYRIYQHELSVLGINPNTVAPHALAAAATGDAPNPSLSFVSGASRDQAGSAQVSGYTATSDLNGRAGTLGFRIAMGGASVPVPPVTALQPPTFRLSGTIDEAELAPNLTNLILPNGANPPGTVYRYTIDGSAPTSASAIWSAASFISGSPLPALVRAAAFHTDPQYSTSNIVNDSLSLAIGIIYARSGGGNSTAFTYSEVTSLVNNIVLSVPHAPQGSAIYYTYDGAIPTTNSAKYTAPFQVPLSAWLGTVTLRAIAVTGAANITASPLTRSLSPVQTSLPAPTFGSLSGTQVAVTLALNDAVAGATIRYDIDSTIGGGSPAVPNGTVVTIIAP